MCSGGDGEGSGNNPEGSIGDWVTIGGLPNLLMLIVRQGIQIVLFCGRERSKEVLDRWD